MAIQTRVHSLLESIANLVVGITLGVLGQLLIFPLFGISVPLLHNLAIATLFAPTSIAKGYIIRRWFTKRTE